MNDTLPEETGVAQSAAELTPEIRAAAPSADGGEATRAGPEPARWAAYQADNPDPSVFDRDAVLAAAADLLASPASETPISIALVGPPGSGKTSALRRIVGRPAGEADWREGAAPVIPVWLDAAEADDPGVYVSAKVYEAMTGADGGEASASFAREALASLRDLHAAAREAADRLAHSRQRLETERRTLEDAAGRRARLPELVLFETPGTRIDSYARAHRSRIESRLRSFGFDGDLIAVWKEFVREAAENGPVERLAFCAQSLWSYKGQAKLLLLALFFVLVAWGLGEAESARGGWASWLAANGGPFAGLGSWLKTHSSVISSLEKATTIGAALCVLVDVWRASTFLNPIFKGASLLKADLDARRRDLEAQIAHQTRRVDLLGKEVDAQARRADEAERRADAPGGSGRAMEDSSPFFAPDDASPEGRRRFAIEFLDALDRVMAREPEKAPRILAAVDGLERLSPADGAAFLNSVSRVLSRRGFAAAYAIDDERIASGFGDDRVAAVSRLAQITIQVVDAAPMVEWVGSPPRSLSQAERKILDGMARFVKNPRERKRFINSFLLARACGDAESAFAAGLAVALLADKIAAKDEQSMHETASALAGETIPTPTLEKARALAARFRLSV